ncbi:MAG: sulfite exporter TauE/SafE family protein [Verrucomicrobiota bacterium]
MNPNDLALSAFQWGVFTLAMAAAGFVQGVTGFGFAIVAMAILPLPAILGDFQAAFMVVGVTSVIIPFFIVSAHRKEFVFRPMILLLVSAMVGTVVGFALMDQLSDARGFLRGFGACLVIFAIADLWLRKAKDTKMPPWMALPCGILSGLFGGAFNMGGPPLVAFVYSQPWSMGRIIASLQIVFLASSILRLSMMGGNGYFQGYNLALAGLGMIPTAVGLVVGTKLLPYLPPQSLRQGVLVIVALLGIWYLVM